VPAGSLVAADLADVTADLVAVLDELRPDVVVTLDGSDGHRDHRHVRAALEAALAASPDPRPAMWEHTLPASLLRRWLAETAAARGDDAYHALEEDSFGRPDADVTDVLDVRDVLAQREAAIAEHRSQASPFDGLSPALREAFLVTDHLVRVPLPERTEPEAWRSVPGMRTSDEYWDCTDAGWRPRSTAR
jgi:N-acetyl-1-D-myo-inositol-2-amino-2-deoxy-alpha-D-glucopyranoside deacetylase